MPCLPHERLVRQHYDLPFVKPTTLQQQIGPSPRMPLLNFSSRLKLRASYSNTQISLLSLFLTPLQSPNKERDRTLNPNPNPSFGFQILGFLGRFSFRHFDLCRFFCFFYEYAIRLHPCVQVSGLFSRKILHQFLGCLWPRSPQVLDSSSPSSLWFFLFSVESG